MFVGGADTTYTILEWQFCELLSACNEKLKLQEEVQQVAKGNSKITEEDLDQMHYLKAVVKETLRMHTRLPLFIPREMTE